MVVEAELEIIEAEVEIVVVVEMEVEEGAELAPELNAMTEEITSVTLTGEQPMQWEKWQQGKALETSHDSTSFGNFANYAHVGEGTQAHALASIYKHSHINWIIDSGASKHATGSLSAFASYTTYTHSETVQTADRTSQLIQGVGSVECTTSIDLPSVLRVPSFPINLLSVSSIIDQFKCTVTFDEDSCLFQGKRTGKRIGTGIRRNGLWYIDQVDAALVVAVGGIEREVLLYHRRLRHLSFESLSQLYPDLFKIVDKSKLVCDACEFGKHTQSTYSSIGFQSYELFILIYSDVWGPCSVTSVSGFILV